jgi:protein sidekick
LEFELFQVSSVAGDEKRSAKLSVVELPFAPSNVQVKRLSSPNQRTVNISWTPGFDGNSPIIKYIVQKREVLELGKFKSNFPSLLP